MKDTKQKTGCKNCYPKPNKSILVSDVKNPYCLACGKKLGEFEYHNCQLETANHKTKKKIDNNCQCLCHFDTKPLMGSVKYCDRCIEIHKTEPISPFKPNGWVEKELERLDGIIVTGAQSRGSAFDLQAITDPVVWIETIRPEIKKSLSQAILSAEKETVKRCIEALEKIEGVYLIENMGIRCKKCGEIVEKHIIEHEGVYINLSLSRKALESLSLPDQEQLTSKEKK